MAPRSTGNGTRRSRKAASVQPPTVLEPRRNAIPADNVEDEIRRRAYEIYLQRGGTPGNENEDWLVAEQEVRARQMQQAG